MKHIVYILLFLFGYIGFAQNQTLFDKANALYNEGKYEEAITNYKAILETANHSADLYFNLANAHYKLNNIAPSIYYYEKALQLEQAVLTMFPPDPSIQGAELRDYITRYGLLILTTQLEEVPTYNVAPQDWELI